MELSTVEDILFLYNLPSFVTRLTIAYEWWIGADGYFVYIKDHKNGNTAQEVKFVRVNSSARKPVFNWKHDSRSKCALDPHPRFRSNCRFAGQNEKKEASPCLSVPTRRRQTKQPHRVASLPLERQRDQSPWQTAARIFARHLCFWPRNRRNEIVSTKRRARVCAIQPMRGTVAWS